MTKIEPPSGSERTYLDAFRDTTAMPEAARDRVWARLSAGPLGPAGGEAANDAGPSLASAQAGGRAWLSARSGLLFAASAAVVTGAIVLAIRGAEPPVEPPPVEPALMAEARATPPVREPPDEDPIRAIRAQADTPSEAPSASLPHESEASPQAPQVEHRPPKRSPRRARAKPEPAPLVAASSLADERRLIERTHAALGKGELDLALSLLQRHALTFESGVFVEEREALLAIATCTAGRLDEGRRAALSFLASYPQAVLAARVRSSCALGE
ncbi:MAG: hypothetical protein R6X02_27475 [Enhygromyxa sp.]